MKRNTLMLPLMILSGGAFAYDMNPIDVSCWGNVAACRLVKMTEKMKFPVHESITLLAWDFYLTPDSSSGGEAKSAKDVLQKKGRLRDLVIGSEWNDDPDSLLRQSVTKSTQWYALFKDAKLQSDCKKNPGDEKCKGKEISKNPMLLYRSHFGDLQFLHSMASTADEQAEKTKQRMMMWAKFAYQVYIAADNSEKTVIDGRAGAEFAAVAALLNKPGWTVGALFDPEPGGEWKASWNPLKLGNYVSSGKPRQQNSYDGDEDTKISVRYVALGSLLHMIQDSYSDSHTERENGCNPIARAKGKILSFRNYADQDAEAHGIADARPDWIENGMLKKNNPLWASAQLIQFAFNKVPWDKGVEEFLDKEVFPLNDPQQGPRPGDRGCFAGTN